MYVHEAHEIAEAIFPNARIVTLDDVLGTPHAFRLDFGAHTIEVQSAGVDEKLVGTWSAVKEFQAAEPFTPLSMSPEALNVRVEVDRVALTDQPVLVGWLSFIRTRLTKAAKDIVFKALKPSRFLIGNDTVLNSQVMRAAEFLFGVAEIPPVQLALKHGPGFTLPWIGGTDGERWVTKIDSFSGPAGAIGFRWADDQWAGRMKVKVATPGLFDDRTLVGKGRFDIDRRLGPVSIGRGETDKVKVQGQVTYLEMGLRTLADIRNAYAEVGQKLRDRD